MDDQFTPDELNLIEELKTTKPKMNASRARDIHQQIINEFRAASHPSVVRHTISRVIILRTAAVLAAAIVLIVLVVGQIENQQSGGLTPIVSPTDNQVAALPSVTFTPTPKTVMSTPTQTVEMTATSIAASATLFSTQPVSSITPTSQAVLVVIEGQVSNIVGNVVTVNGFDVDVAPDHPILQIIEVGDSLHVEGVLSGSSQIIPRLISNLSNAVISGTSKPVTVGLDGPVEAIKDNLVTVNGIPVRFEPDDPILKSLTVGNFVSVQGNFSGSGESIVLVVVNVTVFNNITVINNNCWFDPGPDDGMGMGMEDPAMGMAMGHWHCDGMGMGAPAMGMGDDGMGMGK